MQNGLIAQSVRTGLGQQPDADFLEPDDVAWVVVLEADVALLWSLRFTLGFVPLFASRQVGTCGVQTRAALPIEMHEDVIAIERDDHGLPLAGLLQIGG